VSVYPYTQSVSLDVINATLPLPTGAATNAPLLAIAAQLPAAPAYTVGDGYAAELDREDGFPPWQMF
jgi:hypothetical protein